MKLSEILSKPIKLIGGGILNLKGFSKQVVDTEVGDSKKYYSTFNELINDFKQRYLFDADFVDVGTMTGEAEQGDAINIGEVGIVGYIDLGDNTLYLAKITSKRYNSEDETYIYDFQILKILGSYQQVKVYCLE